MATVAAAAAVYGPPPPPPTQSPPPRPQRRRLRIGVVGFTGSNISVGRVVAGFLAGLSRERFHVTLFALGVSASAAAAAVARPCPRCASLPPGLDSKLYSVGKPVGIHVAGEPFTAAIAERADVVMELSESSLRKTLALLAAAAAPGAMAAAAPPAPGRGGGARDANDFVHVLDDDDGGPMDVLLFTEIAAIPSSLFLSFVRVAPVQLFFGIAHCVTTGGGNEIDYYVSSDELEVAADTRSVFGEQLVRFSSTAMVYPRPPTPQPAPNVTRRGFGLSDDAHVYASIQHKLKYHPAFDDAIVAILAADPLAVIVMLQPSLEFIVHRVSPRLLPEDRARLVAIPGVHNHVLLAFLAMADVVLDTFPWGGGITSIESLAMCAPTVTMHSAERETQFTVGFYHRMGMGDRLVARSVSEYAALAVAIATTPALSAQLRADICARVPVLFDDPEAVPEWERFLERAVRAAVAAAPAL
jgi:predicted O-linked N-acetylglucosamine transferase (SPINDLY family)